VKRAAFLAFVALVALTSACTSEQRPEGITERWLLSLNQGPAGRPDRFAPDEVSQQIVPGWQDLDPGHLNVVEVSRPDLTDGDHPTVGFRIVTVDGNQTLGTLT
jgi:hypothetical protein